MTAAAARNVLLGPSSFGASSKEPLERLEQSGCRVVDNPCKRRLTREEIMQLLEEPFNGLIAGLEPLDREVLEGSTLTVISRCGSGMSNVDLEAAKDLGIRVYSTPDAPVRAVAELTVGALIALLRGLALSDRRLRRGEWSKLVGGEIAERTVAVVGFGRIGKRVAELLRAFGARVLAVDPAYSGTVEGVPVRSLDEALREADVVTIHTSGRDQILGARQFKAMRPGTYILNAARGHALDEEALVAALDDDTVAGAWLDVFSREPYEGPLTGYDQVVLTPHLGSYTGECRRHMETQAVENLLAGFEEAET